MVDKKTLVLAVALSWILTLVTVLLIYNFAPSVTQVFFQQDKESNSVKVVTLLKEEIRDFTEIANLSSSPVYTHLVHFNLTWIPSNPNKNSIVALFCSFEYSSDEPSSNVWESVQEVNWKLRVKLDINKFYLIEDKIVSKSASNMSEWNQKWSSEWETTTFQATISSSNIQINQNQYPIKLTFAHNGVAPTYIRNVNLMLLVIDG